MCQFAQNHPADWVFQIGPSFTEMLGDPETVQERESKRRALWKIWEIQKVAFYSVDAIDLNPSLQAFLKTHETSQISLVSSNIVLKNGKLPFQPFWIKEFFGKKIAFLSFSEKPEKQSDASWKVEPLEVAFEKINKEIGSQTDVFYVLGALSPTSRSQISALTSKPILFLGGSLEEDNSTHLEAEGEKDFGARTASFGRGFGELAVGNFETDLWGKPRQAELGGLSHSFWSYLLSPGELVFNECSRILEKTKPQSLPTEASKSYKGL